jgi:hypothetical protein
MTPWKKIDSKRWDFDEFSICLYRWEKEIWDVELWHGPERISFTEAFTKKRATEIAEEKMKLLDTREKILQFWKENL